MILPQTPEKREVRQVNVTRAWPSHDMAEHAEISISFSRRILMSYANDGRVILRVLGDTDAPEEPVWSPFPPHRVLFSMLFH